MTSFASRKATTTAADNRLWRCSWLTANCLWIQSFRMTSFAPREAMTTAEPPEPLDFQYSEFILLKQIL